MYHPNGSFQGTNVPHVTGYGETRDGRTIVCFDERRYAVESEEGGVIGIDRLDEREQSVPLDGSDDPYRNAILMKRLPFLGIRDRRHEDRLQTA